MRNLPSTLMCIASIYFFYIGGFHWYFLILIAGALAFWEYPVKENIELVKVSIEESKARTENIRWATKLSETTVKLNLATLEMMKRNQPR